MKYTTKQHVISNITLLYNLVQIQDMDSDTNMKSETHNIPSTPELGKTKSHTTTTTH